MFLYGLSTLPYDFEDWESLIEVELVHKDKTENRFLEKEQKREQTKEISIIYCFYDIILLFKSIQVGRAQIFFNLTQFGMGEGAIRIPY